MSSGQPENSGHSEASQRVIDLIGSDLLVRDEWGLFYDEDDYRARDQLFYEAELIVDGLASEKDVSERGRLTNDAERIKRIAAALNSLQSYALLAEESPEHCVLRPYQIPVLRDICDFFEYDSGERLGGLVVLPTGVGKTIVFNEVIMATGLRTLVVADTNEQVQQNHDKLNEFLRGRVVQPGIVDGHHKQPGLDVTYTTYASLLNEVRKPATERLIKPEDYDLAIFDEAHLILGENRRTVLRHFKQAVKIAFTATDRYSEDKHVGILFPHEISRMTLEEAENKKLVAPHHNIIVQTSTDMRHVPVASTGDYAKDILFNSINTDERNLVAVQTYIDLFFGKKIIDFCGGIQHAKDLAKMYRDHGIPAEAVWGDMPDDDRRKIFQRFREGSLMHITNADLVSTGFDMLSVEGVFMLQPSLSELRTMQIGGRSNRIWDEKPQKVSYVVQFLDDNYAQLPVIFAESEAAGHAQHGWDGFIFPEIDVSMSPYSILVDPIDVEWLALKHFEGRRRKNSLPPPGWASLDDLKILSNRPLSHIKKAYAEFLASQQKKRDMYQAEGIDQDEDGLFQEHLHTGLYMNPATDGGRKRYFSPEFIDQMANHLEQFRLKESVLWRRPVEVQEIMGMSSSWVNNSLIWRVRQQENMAQYEAQLVEYPTSVRKLLHFHFEMYKAGVEREGVKVDINDLIVPPERMHPEDKVRDWLDLKYGYGSFELALSRSRQTNLGWGNNAGSIVYDIDGELQHFYSLIARKRLEDKLLPPLHFKPLAEILNQGNLVLYGVTIQMVRDEAELLLPKVSPYVLGLYFDKQSERFDYFGRKEILAHIFERLLRAQLADKSAAAILEILVQSPLLVKTDEPTPIVVDEIETDIASESVVFNDDPELIVDTTKQAEEVIEVEQIEEIMVSSSVLEAKAKLLRSRELKRLTEKYLANRPQ